MRNLVLPWKRTSTAVMPGPSEATRLTLTPSRAPSHPASSAALGFPTSAWTSADVGTDVRSSNPAASSARHGVVRVQARSVSPGA